MVRVSGRLHESAVAARLTAPGSDVWEIHEEAVGRARRGEDIILLSVGDPDFPTPDYIADHTVAQIKAGRTHYSPPEGELGLRRTIAALESAGTGRAFDADQFVIFPGATAALYSVFTAIADPGDEVVVPEPMYAGYRGMFDALGIRDVAVSLIQPDFLLDVDALLAAVTPRTRAVLVNTPGNPCGNLIPPERLAALARGCRERNVWLVCDEVYSLITFEARHVSLLRSTTELDNVVVIDGLSKSHAMSGWRIGWAVVPPALVPALTRFLNAAFFGTCQFVQDGAAYALAHDAPDVERMRLEYLARRDYAAARLDALPDLGYFLPRGGMFMMLDSSRVANDGGDFARRLLDEAGLSTIPGRAFGPSIASFVRMSLTHPIPVLEEVFDRIAVVTARMARGG